MSCCVENDGGTLKVTLTFKRDQLLYDIKNYAYVESHVMPAETEHAKHMVADVGEDGSTTYYRDAEDTHYVPKRTLEQLILNP